MKRTFGARGGTSGSGSPGASAGGAGDSVACLGGGSPSGEEVRVEAGVLAVGVLLRIGGSAGTLGASSDTAVGVDGLSIIGAGNLVAIGDAAPVSGVTY